MKNVGQKVLARARSYVQPLPMDELADYDAYWAARGGQEAVQPRWRLAAAVIPAGSTVLDVGCGTGGFIQFMATEKPDVTVVGTDVSADAVAICRRAGLQAFQADLTLDPLVDGYDVVTCFEVIEHIHEAERVLVAMRDATRKLLIMSLPNLGYIEHRIRLGVFGRFPNTSLMLHPKEHIRHWTVRDFRDWTAYFGLRVVSVQGQRGFPVVPWRRMPGLFAAQVLYVLEPVDGDLAGSGGDGAALHRVGRLRSAGSTSPAS